MPGQDAAPPTVPARVSRSRRRRSRLLPAALAPVVAVLLIAPACTKDDSPNPTADAPGPTPSTTAAPATEPTTDATTTTTAPPTPEQEVEAAYLEIVDRYYRRFEKPDPNDSSIAENHSGENQRITTDELTKVATAGQIARFPRGTPPVPTVLSVELMGENTALLRICLVDDTQIVEVSTMRVVNDVVSSRLIDTTLIRSDGRWKADSLRLVQRWEDGKGCKR